MVLKKYSIKAYLCSCLLSAHVCLGAATLSKEAIVQIIPRLESMVMASMPISKVPGLAMAIVYDDTVLLTKGYGLRQVDSKLPVDAQTMFQLASLSKPLTACVLAALVDQGKIAWHSKIAELDPAFRLADPWITAELTIEDLLSHRSGLPAHAGDLLEDLGFDRHTILQRLRFITTLGAFRSSYAYTNFGFSEAAFAAAKRMDMAWHLLAKRLLFDPLDMQSSSFTFEDYWQSTNKAILHQIKDGAALSLYTRNADAQSPAGGACSNAQDIAKWLIMLLKDGQYQGKQVIAKQTLLETQKPIHIAAFNADGQDILFYGLGWSIKWDAQGRKMITHSGAFGLGARTYVALMPEDKVAIAIFTNAAWHGLPEALAENFFDLIYQRPLNSSSLSTWNTRFAAVGRLTPLQSISQKSWPALPLKYYSGTFHNDYYGKIEIKEKNKALELIIGAHNLHFPLVHGNRDVFIFESRGENAVGQVAVLFTMDLHNQVKSVTIDYLNVHGNGVFYPQIQ